LLAGGRDKDLSWTKFADWVQKRVDHLILFGEAKDNILRSLKSVQNGERPFTIHSCSCLPEALNIAREMVEPGDVLLLSPGGTSFDEFRDFSERGDYFKEWVNKLT
jgi:UDP-N-acetylmuramoylalanine--D-glutamate ligase